MAGRSEPGDCGWGERLRGKVEELNARLERVGVQEATVNERLEAARRNAAAQFARSEEALLGTPMGEELMRAARTEIVGETVAALSVMQRGEVVELAEEKFGAALDRREGELRETAMGSRYLADAAQSVGGDEERSGTVPAGNDRHDGRGPSGAGAGGQRGGAAVYPVGRAGPVRSDT